jgi:hypothetical protein
MSLVIDVYSNTINKFGEDFCGDRVEIIKSESGVVAILADGLGSGVKANMLASISIKLLATMISRGEPIEEAVNTVTETQPVSIKRNIGYTAFTVIQIMNSGLIYIAELNTPKAVFLYKGKPINIEMKSRKIDSKIIKEGRLTCEDADTIVAFSDGVVNAGVGSKLSMGWQRENIEAYLTLAYKKHISAEKLTTLLLSAGNSLYNNKPGDDLSVLTFCLSSRKLDS